MPKRTLFPVIAIALLGLAATTAHALTPQQIVQRCQSAYNALHTYQGTVTVTATGSGAQTYHTSARIVFARPGKIRASGSTMFGGQYAYVSNGTAAFQNLTGSWSKCQNAEMAIAGATGIAQSAATTLPALLLHTHWGSPFSATEQFSPAVGQEKVDGHACYRLTSTNPIGTETCWIDTQTFLLRRIVTSLIMGPTHLRQDQHITNGPLNVPAPAGTFTPKG